MQPLDPDAVGTVAPGMPYPHAGFGERYIETPSTTSRAGPTKWIGKISPASLYRFPFGD